jgi:branched-subunit amino acid ABC-type transport system permease component
MTSSLDIFLNAISTGIVLGSIYASIALGLAITFGILHIPNVAHPALVIVGAYFVFFMGQWGVGRFSTCWAWRSTVFIHARSSDKGKPMCCKA